MNRNNNIHAHAFNLELKKKASIYICVCQCALVHVGKSGRGYYVLKKLQKQNKKIITKVFECRGRFLHAYLTVDFFLFMYFLHTHTHTFSGVFLFLFNSICPSLWVNTLSDTLFNQRYAHIHLHTLHKTVIP